MNKKKPKLKNVRLLTPEEMREMKVYNDPWDAEEVCPDGKIISCETSGTSWETIFSAQGVMGIRCGNTMVMCNGHTYYATGSGTLAFHSVKCPNNGPTFSCAGVAGRDYEAIYGQGASLGPIGLRCGYEYMFCNGSSGFGYEQGIGSGSGCCGSGSGCYPGSGCCGSGSGCYPDCCGSGSGCYPGSGCCGMKSDDEQNEDDSNLL